MYQRVTLNFDSPTFTSQVLESQVYTTSSSLSEQCSICEMIWKEKISKVNMMACTYRHFGGWSKRLLSPEPA